MPPLLESLRGPGALRLILALFVVVHHVSRVALGTAAVYVFFVLSGFWIWRMWTSKYSLARSPYNTFIISRVWRLMPVFLFVSAVTLVGELMLDSGFAEFLRAASSGQLSHLAFSSLLILGYSGLSFVPIGPAWSLDIELQFYIVAPLFVWLLSRWPLRVIATAIIVSMLFLGTGIDRSLPMYLIFFLIGMRLCQTNWNPSARVVGSSLLAALVLGCAAAAVPSLRPLLMGGATPSPMHEEWSPLFNLVIALLVVPYAIASTFRKGGANDNFYADMAYVVYLLHWVMSVALAGHVGTLPPLQRLVITGAWFVTMMGASYLVWRFIDKPLNRLRARFVNSRMRAAGLKNAVNHTSSTSSTKPVAGV